MGGGEDVGRDVSLNVSVVAGQPGGQWVQPHHAGLNKVSTAKHKRKVHLIPIFTFNGLVNQFRHHKHSLQWTLHS